MRRKTPVLLSISIAILSGMLCGCGGAVSVVAELSNLSITPTSTLATIGTSRSIALVGTYSDGRNVQLNDVATWSVKPLVATIDSTGELKCTASGTALVTATFNDLTATAWVNCSTGSPSSTPLPPRPTPPSTLSITAPGSAIPVGYTLTATAILQSGIKSLDVSQVAAWSVSPSNLASIAAGRISCIQAGPITVTASASSAVGSMSLTCAPSTFNSPTQFIERSEEFVGPFSSWQNLKSVYGAKGDGIADDTAAIQAALNQLSSTHVLYIPAGTYRITAPLEINNQAGFAIIGADPQTTKIIWDGAPGLTMMHINGSTVFRITRLTFDGASSAQCAEAINNSSNGYYITKVELSDQHLLNVAMGIYLGNSAETEITRVLFDHNTSDGVLLADFNDINVFVTDSLFLYCGTGVSNDPGAGAFNIRNNVFYHSTVADIQIGNTGNFSVRNNTSVDSEGNFFLANVIGANNAEITMQGNTVIDPKGTAVVLGDTGPLMLIDNIFRTQDVSAPVVTGWDNSNTPPVAFSLGNIYTAGQPFAQFWGAVSSYDDSTADPSSIPSPSVPTNVFVPENKGRQVFEVAGNDQNAIQKAINAAAASGTTKPIVHLPLGGYLINSTINIPEGSDIQLVGDEVIGTDLLWNVPGSSGPILYIPSGSATVSNLTLNNSTPGQMAGDGLLLQIPDQPTTRIIGDQLLLQGGNDVSISSDGIEHATVDLSSLYTQGTVSGIAVRGGSFLNSGQATLGRIDDLSGSMQSQGEGVSLSITQHGRLLVQDDWHDADASGPYNFQLTDSGALTEQGGGVFAGSTPFVINNFSGDVTLMGIQFSGYVDVSATSNKGNFLMVGMADEQMPIVQPVGSDLMTVATLDDGSYLPYGPYVQAASSSVDVSWLRHMLGQARAEIPVPLGDPDQAMTHLDRVQVLNTQTAVHVVPTAQLSGHYLTLESGQGGFLATGASCVDSTSSDPDAVGSHWILQSAGEGDFLLVPSDQAQSGESAGLVQDASGNWTLVVEPATHDYQQHWNIQLGDDGLFRLINRGTGLLLAAGSGGSQCATSAGQQSASAATWTITAH